MWPIQNNVAQVLNNTRLSKAVTQRLNCRMWQKSTDGIKKPSYIKMWKKTIFLCVRMCVCVCVCMWLYIYMYKHFIFSRDPIWAKASSSKTFLDHTPLRTTVCRNCRTDKHTTSKGQVRSASAGMRLPKRPSLIFDCLHCNETRINAKSVCIAHRKTV